MPMTDADYDNMMRVLRSIDAHLERLGAQMQTLTMITQEAGRVAAGYPATMGVIYASGQTNDDTISQS